MPAIMSGLIGSTRSQGGDTVGVYYHPVFQNWANVIKNDALYWEPSAFEMKLTKLTGVGIQGLSFEAPAMQNRLGVS